MAYPYKLLKIRICLTILSLIYAFTMSAQRVALKTNPLYWATTTLNLGTEVRVAPRWSVDLTVGYNPFTFADNAKLKHVLVQPEARYWLCSTFAGHFIGAHALYSHYNAGNIDAPFGLLPELKEHRFQGNMGGAGLLYGYSWMVGRRWSVEAVIGLGVGVASYRKYLCEVCGTQVDKGTRWFFMPTKLAVSFAYYIR